MKTDSPKRPDNINDSFGSDVNAELLIKFSQVQKTRQRHNRRIALVILLVVATLAASGWQATKYYQRQKILNQIPSQVHAQADFPIYLPSMHKTGLNLSSFDYSNGVLFFAANTQDYSLNFTEQKQPLSFELSKFSTDEGLTQTKEITINNHRTLLGKVLGRSIAIVDTGQTVVTITSKSYVTIETIEAVVRSLQKT